MKKTTKTKAAAPAKKKTAKSAPKAPAAPARKAAPAPKVDLRAKGLPKVAGNGSKAPTVKRAGPAIVETRIVAQIDVGFGNTLYIRGEGPGLNWDRGLAMACVADDAWAVTLPDVSRPVICKFLINDLAWCVGDDFIVMPGKSVTLAPAF